METTYRVLEIFNSIDGEGRRAGALTTFIRMAGCNCSCSWCDTAYSQDCHGGTPMTTQEIINEIRKYNCYNITLTGGEPLLQDNVKELTDALYDRGYDVNLETNGTIDPAPYLRDRDMFHGNAVWATIDYKSKSSGMQSKMNRKAFKSLRHLDVVKFVVGSKEEMEDADRVIEECTSRSDEFNCPSFYFSPVFGMIEPKEIVEFMKTKNYDNNVKVQIQLHKIIWDPKERMV